MKKILLGSLYCAALLSANSEINIGGAKKDYTNSKTKVDGKNYSAGVSHSYENSKIILGYSKDSVNREHPITKATIDTLKVKKYNLKYDYNINGKMTLNTSYIKIIDNLAPTDQGKVYGLGLGYKLPKGFNTALNAYRSDYKQFNVNQYELTFSKGFKINELKAKASISGKSINIDGDRYGTYLFQDKNYFTTHLNFAVNYHGYFASTGAFFGKRIFTVLNDGQKIQHHAMEQDKTYMLALGKKFKDFDIIAKYSFQNGDELPENREDVDQKVTSLIFKYRF